MPSGFTIEDRISASTPRLISTDYPRRSRGVAANRLHGRCAFRATASTRSALGRSEDGLAEFGRGDERGDATRCFAAAASTRRGSSAAAASTRTRIRRSTPLLDRLEAATAAVCREADVALPGDEEALGTRTLDGVLLVGGATRTPALGRMLRRLTGLPLAKIAAHNDGVHPDEAVALGAAIRAAALDVDAGAAAASAPRPEVVLADGRGVGAR